MDSQATCPSCRTQNRPGARFCDECGFELSVPSTRRESAAPMSKGERRQATVLFCDLAGYTRLAEALDPEDVKDVVGRFFGAAASIIERYGGVVEKHIGDAVMAVFGVPELHEDDAVRALHAVLEIHEALKDIGADLKRPGLTSLVAHSGVNTGLVVTGGGGPTVGSLGVIGDAVNVASRLCDQATGGQILVGETTEELARRHFAFEKLASLDVKGRNAPSACYRLIARRGRPFKTHRFAGRRAALVGRARELSRIERAEKDASDGKSSAVFVCGEAGTGKSRLIEDYRKVQETAQWREGHAHDYARGIPYHPIADLLGRAWGIEGDDPPDRVAAKIEARTRELVEDSSDLVPYLFGLYALDHPDLVGVSPEYWKRKLFTAVETVFDAMAKRDPTVFLFEDLHWADPSTLELLRHLIASLRAPVVFLATYRPPFRLLSGEKEGNGWAIEEIVLQPLAASQTEELARALLEGKGAPDELFPFVQGKAEGNPFFVEEVLNALIDQGALVEDSGPWRLTRPLSELHIPATVQGVIAARLDCLSSESRRLLQEASVIGRTFLRPILRNVTDHGEDIEGPLTTLEESGLIRAITLEPDLEYIFKHALTQEVAYSSLLRVDRAAIHLRVGEVMERLMADRLPEFYETLAFHFNQARSAQKAAHYLIKSGEKAVNRFALEEAHGHFRQACELLTERAGAAEDAELWSELFDKWATVFYYFGDFRGLLELFEGNEAVIRSLPDQARRGMLSAWTGCARFFRNRPEAAYADLTQALSLGEQTGNQRVIAYASTWLAMVCGGMGRFEEGIAHGERAQGLASTMPEDHYLHFKSLSMTGFVYAMMGEAEKTRQVGAKLIEFGKRSPRSLFFGYWMTAEAHSLSGDARGAVEVAEKGLSALKDPFYLVFARGIYGMKCLVAGQPASLLDEQVAQSEAQGNGFMVNWWRGFVGLGRVFQGQPAEGMRLIDEGSRACLENGDHVFYEVNQYLKAKVYLHLALSGRPPLRQWLRHIGFYLQHLPGAEQKAEAMLGRAAAFQKKIGAPGWHAQVLLDLGQLHAARGRPEKARACFAEAADLFERIGAHLFLEQTRGLLRDLKGQAPARAEASPPA
jgi:class 3 adenylate cyclase/tetratricopeptide (TPR) repeat protein